MATARHRPLVLLAVSSLAVVLVAGLDTLGFSPLKALEGYLNDLRTCAARKAKADPSLVYLSIDRASIEIDPLSLADAPDSPALQLMNRGWPWSREVYAMIIDRLTAAGARIVAFDLVFPTPGSPEGDEAFRLALERHRDRAIIPGNVIQAAAQGGGSSTLSLPSASLIPESSEASGQVPLVNFLPDRDGVLRRAHYHVTVEELGGFESFAGSEVMETLSAAILRKTGRSGLIPPGQEGRGFRFAGPPGTFRARSIYEIFLPRLWRANYGEGAFFKDKIVIVGPEGTWSHDEHRTPFGLVGRGLMAGPELHLNALNAALQHEFLIELPAPWRWLSLLFAGAAAWIFGHWIRTPSWRIVLSLAALAIYGAIVLLLFSHPGLLLPIAAPLSIFTVAVLGGLAWDFARERRERARVRATLERYVSPEMVREILDNPGTLMNSLGGVRREVTVMFVDLRGFSLAIKESDAAQLVSQLNEFFEALIRHIFATGGTVDKILGDGLMATWGTLRSRGVDVEAGEAATAALEMRESLEVLNASWKARGLRTFRMGIGIALGEVLVGNIGSHHHMNLTVIGEPVNLAARLEKLTKVYGIDLLLGPGLPALLGERFLVQTVDDVTIEGVSLVRIPVSTIAGERDQSAGLADYVQTFEEGAASLRAGNSISASARFRECLNLRPGDPLASLYVRRCEETGRATEKAA